MVHLLTKRIAQNWKSGLTVALVSIPLSISLAIASGASPMAGIITAVWAGLFASIFGGSNFNIVGPAGALSGILAAYALTNGAATLPLVAVIAGLLILVAWIFKLERFLAFVPGSTLHGFTLGVGLIIALNQLNSALGLSGLPKHEQFIVNLWESLTHLGQTSLPTLATFAISLGLIFLFLKMTPKLPGAIIVAPLGIGLGYLTANGYLSFSLATIGSTFPNLSSALIAVPTTFVINQPLITTAITVAFVGILETLLSAKIADGMTKTVYNERKEMFGLGLANIASGAAGGLPATGVLVRTALNVKTGATHKTSAAINVMFVAIISIVLFGWFKYLPMAVIAAILVFAAIRMVNAQHFIRYFKYDKTSFALAMVVAAASVAYDSTIGLVVGIVVALLIFVEKLSRGRFEMVVEHAKGTTTIEGEQLESVQSEKAADSVLVYSIRGHLAYINSQAHLARFREGLQGYKWVVLRLRELYFIDIDGVDTLAEIIDIIQASGCQLALSGVGPFARRALQRLDSYRRLKRKGLIFATAKEAVEYIHSQTSTDTPSSK